MVTRVALARMRATLVAPACDAAVAPAGGALEGVWLVHPARVNRSTDGRTDRRNTGLIMGDPILPRPRHDTWRRDHQINR
jgi:hypothetical protein